MSELRWHPLLREWIITATERQDRTFLPPKDHCPLDPMKPGGHVTEISTADFDVAVFQNQFPSLRPQPPAPAIQGTDLWPVEPAYGICEVVVYTPRHEGTLTDLDVSALEGLIYVWADRYRHLGSQRDIAYVYTFENKGTAIGVTLHHPHGQIYAFPFVPPRLERELESLVEYRVAHGRCLVCDVVAQERREGRRVVLENDHFTAAVPFYARYPYEIHIWSRRHVGALTGLSAREVRSLAGILKGVLLKYDNLWGFSMPYMMVLKQTPTDGRPVDEDHFRIEFYPPHRTKEKLKYLASVESGAGTFINDTLAEERAAELRQTEPLAAPE
jgi:UDPglucose--hexose-1-phosphate uridylyltransferase